MSYKYHCKHIVVNKTPYNIHTTRKMVNSPCSELFMYAARQNMTTFDQGIDQNH